MALASYFADTAIPTSQLPIRMAAVSRCYRAETSNVQEERGIYRYQTTSMIVLPHGGNWSLFSFLENEPASSSIDYEALSDTLRCINNRCDLLQGPI